MLIHLGQGRAGHFKECIDLVCFTRQLLSLPVYWQTLHLKSFVDREAGLAQGIRGTCFEHPLLVYNLGGLRPLGKHYQCYSGTVWCAVRRTPSTLLLLDTHPFGSLSFEGGTLDTQHHYSAPIAYNLICYTSFATTTYQHRTAV